MTYEFGTSTEKRIWRLPNWKSRKRRLVSGHKTRTLVFCTASHYYDEVYKHMTLPENFIHYFRKNKHKLQVAMANRFKF